MFRNSKNWTAIIWPLVCGRIGNSTAFYYQVQLDDAKIKVPSLIHGILPRLAGTPRNHRYPANIEPSTNPSHMARSGESYLAGVTKYSNQPISRLISFAEDL